MGVLLIRDYLSFLRLLNQYLQLIWNILGLINDPDLIGSLHLTPHHAMTARFTLFPCRTPTWAFARMENIPIPSLLTSFLLIAPWSWFRL